MTKLIIIWNELFKVHIFFFRESLKIRKYNVFLNNKFDEKRNYQSCRKKYRNALESCKDQKNSKIRHAGEIDTLTLNNQFKCLEISKIKYWNKRKTPNRENRRPNNCATEKYLLNDNHTERKKKKIVAGNENYADITALA